MNKIVRGWRIGRVEPDGLSVYFDPFTERVEVHDLTPEERRVRLDMVGSVSAPAEAEAPTRLVQTHLFPEGSPHGS